MPLYFYHGGVLCRKEVWLSGGENGLWYIEGLLLCMADFFLVCIKSFSSAPWGSF